MRTLKFKIGAPTIKEFLDRYLEELACVLPKNEKLYRVCMFLSKLTCFEYNMMQQKPSIIAASVLDTAIKILPVNDIKIDAEKVKRLICDFS